MSPRIFLWVHLLSLSISLVFTTYHIVCTSLPIPWFLLLCYAHTMMTVHVAHCQLLELTGSVFLGCALANMQHSAESGQSWCALSEPSLVSHANSLLSHIVKVLCIFAHIIEHREPEAKESKRLSLPTVPRRASAGDTSSPTKPKAQLLESLQRPPLVPKYACTAC